MVGPERFPNGHASRPSTQNVDPTAGLSPQPEFVTELLKFGGLVKLAAWLKDRMETDVKKWIDELPRIDSEMQLGHSVSSFLMASGITTARPRSPLVLSVVKFLAEPGGRNERGKDFVIAVLSAKNVLEYRTAIATARQAATANEAPRKKPEEAPPHPAMARLAANQGLIQRIAPLTRVERVNPNEGHFGYLTFRAAATNRTEVEKLVREAEPELVTPELLAKGVNAVLTAIPVDPADPILPFNAPAFRAAHTGPVLETLLIVANTFPISARKAVIEQLAASGRVRHVGFGAGDYIDLKQAGEILGGEDNQTEKLKALRTAYATYSGTSVSRRGSSQIGEAWFQLSKAGYLSSEKREPASSLPREKAPRSAAPRPLQPKRPSRNPGPVLSESISLLGGNTIRIQRFADSPLVFATFDIPSTTQGSGQMEIAFMSAAGMAVPDEPALLFHALHTLSDVPPERLTPAMIIGGLMQKRDVMPYVIASVGLNGVQVAPVRGQSVTLSGVRFTNIRGVDFNGGDADSGSALWLNGARIDHVDSSTFTRVDISAAGGINVVADMAEKAVRFSKSLLRNATVTAPSRSGSHTEFVECDLRGTDMSGMSPRRLVQPGFALGKYHGSIIDRDTRYPPMFQDKEVDFGALIAPTSVDIVRLPPSGDLAANILRGPMFRPVGDAYHIPWVGKVTPIVDSSKVVSIVVEGQGAGPVSVENTQKPSAVSDAILHLVAQFHAGKIAAWVDAECIALRGGGKAEAMPFKI